MERATGKEVLFYLVANRGKSGTNELGSAHLIFERPVDLELLESLRKVWCRKWGQWHKTAGGNRAVVYWANNAAQRKATKVYWGAPDWDLGGPASREAEEEEELEPTKRRLPFKQLFTDAKASQSSSN